MDDLHTIGVVGGGTMGAEIAHVAAASGFTVLLADADLARAAGGRDRTSCSSCGSGE
jgi:3-hydroxybutyryl-CoA dehydrogenase